MFFRFAFPIFDVADAGGAEIADASADLADSGGSLDDHAASYAPGAVRTADESDDDDRAEAADAVKTSDRSADGRFTKRHRAKSQAAGAEDVPRIQELTRKLRETERALETERASRREPAREPAREAVREEPKPKERAKFPTLIDWAADPKNAGKEWEDYADERAAYNFEPLYAQRRAAEREQDARDSFVRAHHDAVADYLKTHDDAVKAYPDFDEVMAHVPAVSMAVERAAIKLGYHATYYLATHDDVREALTKETWVHPNDPSFARVVALTERYLSSLVAAEQRSSDRPSREAAASTRSAPALVSKPAPKPPNLVRTTGTLRADDALPGDDASLAEHERAFGSRRRRTG